MKLLVPVLFCSTLMFGACHTARPVGQRVDPSLLQYVDEGQRDDITKARTVADKAHDEVAISERKLTEAKGQLGVAEKQLVVTKAKYDKVKAEVAVDGDVPADNAEIESARDEVRAAEAAVRVREAEIRVAEHEVRVAREKHDLARARIDLATANAVAKVDRPECRGIDVTDFERKVRAEEADVQVAEVRLEEATREVKARRETGAADGD